ncbi:hypothetical protein MMPV_004256 [Pyropia vietnamensis]
MDDSIQTFLAACQPRVLPRADLVDLPEVFPSNLPPAAAAWLAPFSPLLIASSPAAASARAISSGAVAGMASAVALDQVVRPAGAAAGDPATSGSADGLGPPVAITSSIHVPVAVDGPCVLGLSISDVVLDAIGLVEVVNPVLRCVYDSENHVFMVMGVYGDGSTVSASTIHVEDDDGALTIIATGSVTAPSVVPTPSAPSAEAAAPPPLFTSSVGNDSPLPSHRTQRPPLYTLPFYGSAADVTTASDALVTAALRTYGGLLRGTPDERRARLAAAAAASYRPRTLTATGVVVSTAMDKSVNVAFRVRVYHRVLKMWSSVTRKRMAHDEGGWAREGDVVTIRACRPLSKRKSAVVVVNYGGGGMTGGEERGPVTLEGALVSPDGRVTVMEEESSGGGGAAAPEGAGEAASHRTIVHSEVDETGENSKDRLVGQ